MKNFQRARISLLFSKKHHQSALPCTVSQPSTAAGFTLWGTRGCTIRSSAGTCGTPRGQKGAQVVYFLFNSKAQHSKACLAPFDSSQKGYVWTETTLLCGNPSVLLKLPVSLYMGCLKPVPSLWRFWALKTRSFEIWAFVQFLVLWVKKQDFVVVLESQDPSLGPPSSSWCFTQSSVQILMHHFSGKGICFCNRCRGKFKHFLACSRENMFLQQFFLLVILCAPHSEESPGTWCHVSWISRCTKFLYNYIKNEKPIVWPVATTDRSPEKTFVAMPCLETIMGCCWGVIFIPHAYRSEKQVKGMTVITAGYSTHVRPFRGVTPKDGSGVEQNALHWKEC